MEKTLNDLQLMRYSRNIVLREIGIEGQTKLLKSRVLVIGAGGLGSPVILYLAAAGVGTIGVADFDVVELSNLQRQIIHFSDDLGKEKVLSAKEKVAQLNPDITVETYNYRLDESNIFQTVRNYDFVVDATDGLCNKLLVNDACVKENIPFSHAGVLGFKGQILTVVPGKSICLRCIITDDLLSDNEMTCSKYGILGSVAGTFGTIQATETIKYITGSGTTALNTLVLFDFKTLEFNTIKIKPTSGCKTCKKKKI